MRNLRQILIVLVVLVFVPLGGQYAAAQQKPKKPKQNPQTDAANKADHDAKAAADKADAAKKSVAEANDAIRAAQKDIDEATKALKKIEDDTIDAQPADSELGKARDAYRAANAKYQEARKSVLEDESFKDKLAKAKEADDGGEALLALHKEFDETPAIADSRAALQTAKEAYDPLKTKLLQDTPDWGKASDDLKAKRTALDDAKHKYSEAVAAAARAKAAAIREKAAAQAAAARAAQPQAPQAAQPTRRRPY